MYSAQLSTSTQDNPANFEYIRWHGLNYLLRQGKIVLRSPIPECRNRPEWYKQEFATIVGDNIFYSFIVDSFSSSKIRRLEIFVSSPSEPALKEAVAALTKNNAFVRS